MDRIYDYSDETELENTGKKFIDGINTTEIWVDGLALGMRNQSLKGSMR
jgi:hypothetical protein